MGSGPLPGASRGAAGRGFSLRKHATSRQPRPRSPALAGRIRCQLHIRRRAQPQRLEVGGVAAPLRVKKLEQPGGGGSSAARRARGVRLQGGERRRKRESARGAQAPRPRGQEGARARRRAGSVRPRPPPASTRRRLPSPLPVPQPYRARAGEGVGESHSMGRVRRSGAASIRLRKRTVGAAPSCEAAAVTGCAQGGSPSKKIPVCARVFAHARGRRRWGRGLEAVVQGGHSHMNNKA